MNSERITKEQMEALKTFMKKNEALARGTIMSTAIGRSQAFLLWDNVRKRLNNLGPPVKATNDWKRWWSLRKHRAKCKLAYNQKSLVTGDGIFDQKKLSQQDEEIIQICGFTEANVWNDKYKTVKEEELDYDKDELESNKDDLESNKEELDSNKEEFTTEHEDITNEDRQVFADEFETYIFEGEVVAEVNDDNSDDNPLQKSKIASNKSVNETLCLDKSFQYQKEILTAIKSLENKSNDVLGEIRKIRKIKEEKLQLEKEKFAYKKQIDAKNNNKQKIMVVRKT